MPELDLCANCGHWREEHYGRDGVYQGDEAFGCPSYLGSVPSPDRAAKKTEQLVASRKRLEGQRDEQLEAFYSDS